MRIRSEYLTRKKFPVGRQDLWYVPLAEQHYSFESNICHIPAGENIQLYPIHFNFNGLELDEKYVLPLTIEEDPSYVQNQSIRDVIKRCWESICSMTQLRNV